MDSIGLNDFQLFRRMNNVPWNASGVPGVFAETLPRKLANTIGATTSGVVLATAGILAPKDVVNAITVYSSAGGTTMTHTWAGIADANSLTVLAVSADNTSATLASGFLTFNLTSPYINGFVIRPIYIIICATGTTPPQWKGLNDTQGGASFTPPYSATFTGNPTPMAVGTVLSGQGVSSVWRYAALS